MRETINRKKKIAPIVVAVLVVLYIGPLVLMMAALAGFLGVLAAMAQRLREIDGGEEEDAKKY